MDYKTVIKNISTNLKKLRKDKYLTQEKVIEEIGEEKISLRSYKTYEGGKVDQIPQLDKLAILADYFHVSLDYLVFSRPSTYDDSYTKIDCIKRLIRLIYSLTLTPIKDTNPESEYFGKYIFLAFDDEVTQFMDEYGNYSAKQNSNFEYKSIKLKVAPHDIDDLANSISGLNDDWSPSLERLNSLLIESGNNPEAYLRDRLERINKKRTVEAAKHK